MQTFFEKILDIALEFLEETEIVLKVIAQVLPLPFEHGNPLDTHSEGKSAHPSFLLTIRL